MGLVSIVRIMPWFNPEYHAYFMRGIEEVFGRISIRIDPAAFPDLRSDWYAARDTFAFVIDDVRYSISANDFPTTNGTLKAWSDVHGAVNTAGETGVIPVGPNFAVRWLTTRQSARLLTQSLTWRRPRGWGRRGLLATLRRERQRAAWSMYQPSSAPEGGKFYYQGTYWAGHPQANMERVAYLKALRSTVGLKRVAGGLVPNGGSLPADLNWASAQYVPHPQYVEAIKRSPFVFNHPAVHGCLGWKLGEFFALGKAIISTPLANAVPGHLEHGTHWHVTDVPGLPTAIEMLAQDGDYRRHLEVGAASYYSNEISPKRVIERLLDAATNPQSRATSSE